MPKVLVTPRSFAQYSDLPYEMLQQAGIEVIKNPIGSVMSKDDMLTHIKDVDGIIVGVDPLDKEVLEASSLKAISKYGVGTDNIDLDYCKANDIDVSITRNANSEAVADYAFTLLLGVARRVVEIDAACRRGDWSKKVAVDVFGKKIGVVGLGAIGRGVVARAKGFNMDVYGYDIFKDDVYLAEQGVTFADIAEMLRVCDFISLHMPLTPETKDLINAENLKTAKKNLILVNTARGGIINEDDLYDALKNKQIFGAGIDAFLHEPATESNLLELDNVVLGTHTGASTVDAVDNMSKMAAVNIIEALQKRELL